jgi:hypothetical protein
VEQYPPETDYDRYLVSVAFLQEHRHIPEGITMSHVYTCFRKQGWGTAIKDFSQPLRQLKSQSHQLLAAGPVRGTYSINHLGLDKVHKLSSGKK